MNIENVIHNVLNRDIQHYSRVEGGKDTSVWKVVCNTGCTYAFRILPAVRHHQFVQEKAIMELANNHGIPVPNIYLADQFEQLSVMVMDWIPGRTILEELHYFPEHINHVGYEFEKIQAKIHQIKIHTHQEDSFTPGNEKERMIQQRVLEKYPMQNVLIHLDYHPLNVLTDGKEITGVIDWINASYGNFQFDIARAKSILDIEGAKIIDSKVLQLFIESWLAGYETIGRTTSDLDLFYDWAIIRMERDARERS